MAGEVIAPVAARALETLPFDKPRELPDSGLTALAGRGQYVVEINTKIFLSWRV